jgi:hypothetical protein
MTDLVQIACQDLIVYTDFSYKMIHSHKAISNMKCKAQQENRPCTRRGVCIEARTSATWKRVNTKTFQKESDHD